MCNFLFAVAIQFQEIITLTSHMHISVCKLTKDFCSMVDETPILFMGHLVHMYGSLVISEAHNLPKIIVD